MAKKFDLQKMMNWNNTKIDFPDLALHQLFEKQVLITPNHIAVVIQENSITYKDLEERANQLAHYLEKYDIQKNTPIGVYMNRSIEMVIVLIGVLKIGAAYLPIDPDTPKARIKQILTEAGSSLCISQSEIKTTLPTDAKVTYIDYDSITKELSGLSIKKMGIEADLEQLVSVYYTSGTTGKPKCVANKHKGYVNKINAMQRAYPLVIGDTVLQKATIAFDDSSLEIFWPLSFGGTLALMEPGLHRDPRAIVDALIRYKVKYMYIVSSMLSRVLDVVKEDDKLKLTSLQGVFAGADPLTSIVVRRYLDIMPGVLYNTWGSTEVSIDATIHECTTEDRDEEGSICIGKPFDNVQVYILNEYLEPVIDGNIGDLFVGGVGISRGYLNDDKRTEEMFIDNPFLKESKMYKTGDKGYYRPDGSIKFAGRVDNQVKIRGIRIELEEIEAVLRTDKNVKEAAVILREDTPGNKKIAAYIVLHKKKSVSISQLKLYLKSYLPDYMYPNFIFILESLPLNQNDKLDKRALPIPDAIRPIIETKFVEPRTNLERKLIKIFSEILHIEKVGIYDDFFDLGGDSISATQVMTSIRSIMVQDIPLKVIFELKSVEKLAKYFSDNYSEVQKKNIIPYQRANKDLQLSYSQERIWVFQEMNPDISAYNEATAFRLFGALNIKILNIALNKIIERQESLRTYYKLKNDQPVQNISDKLSIEIPIINLRNELEKENIVKRLMTEDAQVSFNLQELPLFRVNIYKIGEDEWILYFNMHHIITDGWSTVVFLKELKILYAAYSKNKNCPLEDLPIQYADFTNWQREWLKGKTLNTQLDFWRIYLSGDLPILQLPTDYNRGPIQTYNGNKYNFKLERKIVEGISKMGKKYKASDYMIMLAVFNILLHRYSGQDDILVCSPIANRNHNGIDDLIGFFANTVVIRSKYKKEETFESYLLQIRENCIDIYNNQDVPFEQLLTEIQPNRSLSHAPLVQVMFSFQNKFEELLELPNITSTSIPVNNKTAKYELTFYLTENSDGEYEGIVEYNTDLYKSSRVKSIVEKFKVLLKEFTTNPLQENSKVNLLSNRERQKLIEFNQTTVPFQNNKCLHEIFEEQVMRTPDNIAVIFDTNELTYRELDLQANKLANFLTTKGVGPDKIVGICIERSIELIVGLLGILKAGGAFLPLDPEAPNPRLKQIINNAGCEIFLAQNSLKEKLLMEEMEIIYLDSEWGDIDQQTDQKPTVAVTQENMISAYYTSGSTGQPKGVINLHKGWVNRMKWMQSKFMLQSSETVLQKTTLTFDDAAVELFWPLMVGGRIALIAPGLHRDPREIINASIRYNTVHLQFVPSMLNMVLDELNSKDRQLLSSLRNCISSGEALSPKTVEHFFERMPGKLHNTWGATEVSIDSTIHTCSEQDIKEHGSVSIGKPIDNNEVYILDEFLQPVPIGILGDLYIAGIGLAKGYLNDIERTNKAFISNPFNTLELMYKTGDRGYYLQDGSIKFVGREDNQVKIRGMRVELGEIETTLLKHSLVKEAVVIMKNENIDLNRLIAFIVPQIKDSNQILTVENIRNYLKRELPEYMIPSYILFLDVLPLNANGKIDNEKLLAINVQNQNNAGKHIPPKTMAEKLISNIWKEILKLDEVGVDENFYNLGGHSLLATQVASRLRRQYNIEIPLGNILMKPTISELAIELEEKLIEKIRNMTEEESYDLSVKN
ncbi:non-ribosomal peptide synthetase [Sporosarcina limicola]|uniref:Amino acid adenylation domain-containing protein n=1 Tax=Sporosarcina limicola TaxID=34101 RepID=A0A927RF04_9BACL|nr:non-ribosomal peptide synthetase [Sporosarcina limicola]MBE1556815.1 amino acid adenylation domain-containing protein [Sporosarcina limicola]